MANSYLIAANDVVDETIVNRSRFICFISPCSTNDSAKSMVRKYQQLHPQASHHCYAFLTGRPEDSQGYGFSDDGEPSGTAGRPMLSVLQGGGIGELCAVVVRYFGGTKLGTGGLQRAYGGSVRQALALLETQLKVPMVERKLTCGYEQINNVLYLLAQLDGEVIHQNYASDIDVVLAIPEVKLKQMNDKLQTLSAGELQLKMLK